MVAFTWLMLLVTLASKQVLGQCYTSTLSSQARNRLYGPFAVANQSTCALACNCAGGLTSECSSFTPPIPASNCLAYSFDQPSLKCALLGGTIANTCTDPAMIYLLGICTTTTSTTRTRPTTTTPPTTTTTTTLATTTTTTTPTTTTTTMPTTTTTTPTTTTTTMPITTTTAPITTTTMPTTTTTTPTTTTTTPTTTTTTTPVEKCDSTEDAMISLVQFYESGYHYVCATAECKAKFTGPGDLLGLVVDKDKLECMSKHCEDAKYLRMIKFVESKGGQLYNFAGGEYFQGFVAKQPGECGATKHVQVYWQSENREGADGKRDIAYAVTDEQLKDIERNGTFYLAGSSNPGFYIW